MVCGRNVKVAHYYLNICVEFMYMLINRMITSTCCKRDRLSSVCDLHQYAIQHWVNHLFFGVIFRNGKNLRAGVPLQGFPCENFHVLGPIS